MLFGRRNHIGEARQGGESPDQKLDERGFERSEVVELLDSSEYDPEALEEAKRADLIRIGRQITELARIPQDHPDYLFVQRVVAEYEEVLDRVIERVLAENDLGASASAIR